ncbi:hypothetical protein ACIKTA_15705 [Hansschlegelia beijingensis]|uniref:hypothetical protein n=1 Tax=Hansschlegelia beijingensis TaxID=1133344 RepID=UPI0037F6E44A
MITRNTIAAGVAALALAAAPTLAMAQAATGSDASGMGANSAMEQGPGGSMSSDHMGTSAKHKKTAKHQKKSMKGSAGSQSRMKDTPTSAGTADAPVKDLRGHSETPTTGR